MSEEIRKPELPIKLEPLVEKVIKLYTELPEERVEEVNAALVPYLESVGVLCDNLPPLIKGTSNAVKAMKKWTAIESDEDEEDVRVLLGKVKESYEVNSDRRKKITAPADALKDFLMPFEKSVSSDSKEPNEYNRLKGLIVQRQQKKLDEKRRQEAEAARKKAIENHKIDLKLQLQKQLSQMVIDIISRTDSGCKKFWDETTLENFEVNEKKFRSMKVKLKDADFNSYYTFNYDKNLLSDSEFNAFIEDVKKEETFDKWNIEIVEKCTPIVNEWIEKIPEIKLNKEQLAEAASEEEKARLAREQKDKADLDEKRRRQQLEAQQKLIDKENEEKASMDKMENEFGEQIAVQVPRDLRQTTDQENGESLAWPP